MGCYNVTINTGGTPYISTRNVIVSETAVTFALGFRRIPSIGEFNVRVANAIPEGTTATLPIELSLNGVSRPLTYFNGDPVTVADLTGTGVIKVMNDWFNGILQIMSVTAPAA